MNYILDFNKTSQKAKIEIRLHTFQSEISITDVMVKMKISNKQTDITRRMAALVLLWIISIGAT